MDVDIDENQNKQVGERGRGRGRGGYRGYRGRQTMNLTFPRQSANQRLQRFAEVCIFNRHTIIYLVIN